MERNIILITGCAGFVGSKLFESLNKELKNPYMLLGIDKGMFGGNFGEDIRKQTVIDFIKTCDFGDKIKCIIHLSGLSNDPMADFSPEANEKMNYEDTVKLVDFSMMNRIPRFIYASSASVYGSNDSQILNESCNAEPYSNYGKSKKHAEDYILTTSKHGFQPVILRKGTIMGVSPRMRFDLVVNSMVVSAMRFGKIVLYGGGESWRPIVSIDDVITIYKMFVTMDDEKYMCCQGNIFNVVHKNYRISELGLWIGSLMNVPVVADYEQKRDVRSYRISGDKLQGSTEFVSEIGVKETVKEIVAWIKENNPNFDDPIYDNLRWIKNCQKVCDCLGIKYEIDK